jgi:acetyl-CoA carboxylase biotin carboxyl carrier protein
MIGTFYRSSSPEAGPFVKVGDKIQKGQTVCIVEAMKLFNEIESDISGTIVKVLVENASPVEYGQPLFLVDPA